jgi:hypothetical protein
MGCDLRRLGLDPAHLTGVARLREEHGHGVFRLTFADRSFVLKWFSDATRAWEIANYALLAAYGVPTLRRLGQTDNALLLEDLAANRTWRLATAEDANAPATGRAVAAWYRRLHAAGRRVVAGPGGAPGHLRRETDGLDAAALSALGERLGLTAAPGWTLAVESIEVLAAALRAIPTTLVYGDFHWTNLALSAGSGQLRAIVFDYHLLGLGPAESDLRNVSGALGARARATFLEAYGPTDRRAALLDAPVALLYTLGEAARWQEPPRWAQQAIEQVHRGDLERHLVAALVAV